MKHLKTYKIFEDNQSFDNFDLVKEYIYEFCDILDIEIYPNEKREKIYSNTNTNGVLVWRFEDRYNDKTDEPFKYQTFIIDMRTNITFRKNNEDKLSEMLSWLTKRIDDLEIKISENLTMMFYARPTGPSLIAPLYHQAHLSQNSSLKFDLIKKVL
jgi:hypothetical protein